MENQRQKWVNLIFTAVAILVAAVLFVGLSKISAIYNLESSVKSIDIFIRLGSIVLGAAVGFALYFTDTTNSFLNEVVLEMSRVTWPAAKATVNATIWVMVFVLVAGAFLGAFDSLCAWVIKMII